MLPNPAPNHGIQIRPEHSRNTWNTLEHFSASAKFSAGKSVNGEYVFQFLPVFQFDVFRHDAFFARRPIPMYQTPLLVFFSNPAARIALPNLVWVMGLSFVLPIHRS